MACTDVPQEPLGSLSQPLKRVMEHGLVQRWGGGTLIIVKRQVSPQVLGEKVLPPTSGVPL